MVTIFDLHTAYIFGTAKKEIIRVVEIYIGSIRTPFSRLESIPIFLNTRVLKHIYDKRTAREYDVFLEHATEVVQFPTRIYKNKHGQRGVYGFVREINSEIFSAL